MLDLNYIQITFPKPITGQGHATGSIWPELTLSRFNTPRVGMKLVFRIKNHWFSVTGTLPIHSVLLVLMFVQLADENCSQIIPEA